MGYIPPKNIYDAQIGEKTLKVDIYDLPYGEFSAENPLIVKGFVKLADQSRTLDLTNVRIIGGLDISKQKYSFQFPKYIEGSLVCRSHPQTRNITNTQIKEDIFHDAFIFPEGLVEIDCSHSILSLSFLKGRLPNTVKKVIVADALLSNIQSDIAKYAEAKELQTLYPNIVFSGDKKGKTLSETLEIQPVVKEEIQEGIVPILAEEPEPVKIPNKPADFYDVADIFEIARQNKDINSFKILDSTLDRKLRTIITKFNTTNFINPKTGRVVMCVKKDDAIKVIEMLLADLQEKGIKRTKAFIKQSTQPAEIPAKEPVVETPAKEEPVVYKPINTNQQINKEDYIHQLAIRKRCLEDPYIKSSGISDFNLGRSIRRYMEKIGTVTISQVSYISRSRVDELIESIKTELKMLEQSRQETTNSTQHKPEPKKAEQTTTPADSEIIEVRKYIPQKLWKAICKACGYNIRRQKFVLETINAVNIDITKTPQVKHLQVFDPTTKAIIPLTCIKHEDNSVLVQSISTNLYRDNKRIVWSYIPSERILVCTYVFAEHTKPKNSNMYEKVRKFASDGKDANGKEITLQRILDEKYCDTEDLLAETVKNFVASRSGIIKHTFNNNTQKSKDIGEVKGPASPDFEEVKGPANPDFEEVRGPGSAVFEEVKGPTNEEFDQVKSGTSVEPEPLKIKTPTNLAEIKSTQTYIAHIIGLIDSTVNQDMTIIASEPNATKQLQQLDLVRAALKKKEQIQQSLLEYAELDAILLEMKSNITAHQK